MAISPSGVSRFDLPLEEFSAPILTGRTEAEELTLAQGFAVSANPHASGGAYVEATAEVSRAGGVFEGAPGLYDLTLGYMDESDGVSYLEVLVNGAVVAAFDWDRPEGTAIVTATSRTEHLVTGLTLAPGDVIELRGAAEGGEPLRTDFLDISVGQTPAPGDSFEIEAEALQILGGFSVVANGAGSGRAVLQHTEGTEARALYEVQQAGRFDLTLGYFDETDGISSLRVLLNGVEIDAFDWDSDRGGVLASAESRAERVLQGIDLAVGDRLEFVGHGDGGEPLRLDRLSFTRRLETVDYDPFLTELPNVEMVARRGDHIALLTPLADESRYDDAVLRRIVEAVDTGWEFYQKVTGRAPSLHPVYSLDGLGTVAVVERTIGAGGGFLGYTGIEIWADPYFDVWMHDNVRDHDQFDQIPFYELGRNFWFYSGALGALPVDEATSFAVVNRYFAMDFAGVDPAPYNNRYPFDALRDELLDDLAQFYLQDPALDWSNTIEINAGPVLPEAYARWDGSALLVSLFARVMEDLGIDAYARMWQLIGQAPHAGDPEAAAENFFDAAWQATGVDYGFLRKQGGERFFIGDDGDNTLTASSTTAGRAVLHGFAGNDHLESEAAWPYGHSQLFGGSGDDHLVAKESGATLVGGTGNDLLEATSRSYGQLHGGDGDDRLSAPGYLYGEAGRDTFAVGVLVDDTLSHGWMRIQDYQPGSDVIDMGGYPIEYAVEREGQVELSVLGGQRLADRVYINGASTLDEISFVNLGDPAIPLLFEAEDLDILSGFEVVANINASREYFLQHVHTEDPARALLRVEETGTFDITIGYFDETDGVSRMHVLLNGEEIGVFDWNATTGDDIASKASRAQHTLEGVELADGDVLELLGQGDGGEPLRTDWLMLSPVAAQAVDIWYKERAPDAAGDRAMIGANDGSGSFSETDPAVGWDGQTVMAADVDGDGDDDFVLIDGPRSFDSSIPNPAILEFTFSIRENLGGGDFVASDSYALQVELQFEDYLLEDYLASPASLTFLEDIMELQDAADVDGDGDVDLLATSYVAQAFLIFENDGAGHFQVMAQSPGILGSNGSEALFGDFNGDEALDVVVATAGDYAGIWMMINDGSGQLSFGAGSSPSDDSARDPQVVDLDGDGDQDVLFIGGGDGHGIFGLLNDGTGNYQRVSQPSISPGDFATVGSARAADFDGDGKVEVVAAGLSNGTDMPPGLRVFEVVSSSEGVDFVETGYDPRFSGNVKAPADYDLDGDVDLLLTQSSAEGYIVTLLRNDGTGQFEDGGRVIEPFSAAEYSWGPQVHLGTFDSLEALV